MGKFFFESAKSHLEMVGPLVHRRDAQGNQIDVPTTTFTFKNGRYETSSAKVAAFIRNSSKFKNGLVKEIKEKDAKAKPAAPAASGSQLISVDSVTSKNDAITYLVTERKAEAKTVKELKTNLAVEQYANTLGVTFPNLPGIPKSPPEGTGTPGEPGAAPPVPGESGKVG